MALTLEQLQAQRDKLVSDMGKTFSEISSDSDRLVRRSQADLEDALKRTDAEIARLQSSPSRQFTVQTSRGI
ncbi:hypothetical protein [uncultured Paludibaculum sp.]|uniref:hypothetical protein n=1 Tax=uncultured Paludibaculum sp. TaxID=1765020 RepID=UPI002AABADF6|nr:hypothetical protein [uncultured Paludibaculum sp.]